MWRTTTRLSWGIVLISTASLAYEITLTRIFAVQQFYHFAFVVISIATMGFAASGTLLSLRERPPQPHILALAFSITTLLAYVTINTLPFDSYSLAWERRQWWILLLYFVVSGAPFLIAGWAIGAALDAAGTDAYRPYAANLFGSALGCPLALLCIDYLGGEGAIGLIISLGLIATAVLIRDRRGFLVLLPAATFTVIIFSIPLDPLSLSLSPYKPLSNLRLAPQAQVTVTEWGPVKRLDVIESPGIHNFPGLSLNAAAKLPEQAGVFLDGEGPLPITRLAPEDPLTNQIKKHLPSAIAYDLRSGHQALILDWGAGTPALFALAKPGTDVHLPSDQPIVIGLLRGPYADFSFRILERDDLSVLGQSSRSALTRKEYSYDVIEFALSDPFHPVTSGAFNLGEDYLLTVEAFTDAWSRLDPDGILVITRWVGTPPSESARTWNTLLTALRDVGLENIERHVVAFRGMRTATLLASPRAFNHQELQAVRRFLEINAFDPLVLPDLDRAEVNRHNRLPTPIYHELFTALLNNPGPTIRSHTFRLDAPTDNQPFFFHFFRWGQTPEVLASLGLFWQPFGGSGYFVLLVLMALMVLLAVILISLSLLMHQRQPNLAGPNKGSLLYFAALGSGYLLVEIPLIQQFTLLLDHPAQSLAGVLFILLLGSGIGSWISPRVEVKKALIALLVYLAITLFIGPMMIHSLLASRILVRWLALCFLLLPLGIVMGIPFASGLRHIESSHSGWIPWAWAVNGAFSGISGVGAAMIALDAGIQATLFAGWIAYTLALLLSGSLVQVKT